MGIVKELVKGLRYYIISTIVFSMLLGMTMPGYGINKLVITDEQPQEISLTFAGDCTLGDDVGKSRFAAKVKAEGPDYFFGNISEIFSVADYAVVNMEGTLLTGGKPSPKQFRFKGAPSNVEILTSAGIDAVTLANNHSMDYGTEGFTSTNKILKDAGIATAYESSSVVIDEKNGIKFAILGLTGWTKSTKQLDAAIAKAKEGGAEYIVAYFHWGKEATHTPDATQKYLAHYAIDHGVNTVIGSHAHVIQEFEHYNDRHIFYGLGNFVFGGNSNPKDKDALVVSMVVTRDKNNTLSDYAVVTPVTVSSVQTTNDYQPTVLREIPTRIADKMGIVELRENGIL